MVQGQVFLKGWGGGGWHFPYLIFSRFIIFTFRNYLLTLPFAKLCYLFEEKCFFLPLSGHSTVKRNKVILR